MRARVTPRSTHRKRRSPTPPRDQLAPAQGRSLRRHEEILSAVGRLLAGGAHIEDLSHSDIATEAGISKPSVHYHFPTIAALQRELGRRHDEELYKRLRAHAVRIGADRTVSWQEHVRRATAIGRDYFNASRPACEALYGPMLHRDNRLAALGYNSMVASGMLETLQLRFVLPPHPNFAEVFTANGEILDLFWSASYLRHGLIDDRAFEESLRASFGYLRNFLPDVLSIRHPDR